MKAVDIPDRFGLAFAQDAGVGYVRAIPKASQIGVNDGYASLTDGFPPLNFLPIGAGGVPPFGQDMNGILLQATAWNQWQGAGGPVKYDATFAADIGGYPAGAIVSAVVAQNFWYCLVDDNTSNPDTGGAGWLAFKLPSQAAYSNAAFPAKQRFETAGSYSFTVPAGVFVIDAEVYGGGGGGGTGQVAVAGGAGGGGGGYARKKIAVTPGQIIAVTVGIGGAGGPTGTQTAGSNGGTTSFAAYCSATGGGGGEASVGTLPGTPASSVGGVGSGGDVNLRGSYGGSGASGTNAPGGYTGFGGIGGSNQGLEGGANNYMSTGSGGDGIGYGCGGSGGGSASGIAAQGGSGSPGAVVVSWVDPS